MSIFCGLILTKKKKTLFKLWKACEKVCTTLYRNPVCVCVCVCVAEISNLLVVTKDRAPTPPTPMQESQLSFHRILKEEIEQVHLLIFMSVSYVVIVIQLCYRVYGHVKMQINNEKISPHNVLHFLTIQLELPVICMLYM